MTTLEKLLLSGELGGRRNGALKLLAVEESGRCRCSARFAASLGGKLGRSNVRGVHFEEADEITIEGDSSNVILDGETFRAESGRPINLQAGPSAVVRQARRLSRAHDRAARLVAEELSLPVDPRVAAMAEAIAAKHGAAVARGALLRLVPAGAAARWPDARFLPDRVGLSRGLRQALAGARPTA